MAVEIIRPGIIPEEQPYQATCRHCFCEFRFNMGDAKYNHDQRDGDYLSIGCPTCARQVTAQVRRLDAQREHDARRRA